MRPPDWQTEDGAIRLFCGDARDCFFGLQVDAIVTDPVWPNCPPGMLQGSDRAVELLAETLSVCDARTVVIMLGFDSDPRFLQAVPGKWPFIRSQQMPYAVPSYRGRLLGGDEMAYVFGAIPKGRGVIPGRLSTVTTYKAERATGHPCPRADQHLKDLVKWWTRDGDVVGDPFCGTGSTAIGAIAHGRGFVGCEIERKYFNIAVKRITDEIGKLRLFEKPPKIVQRSLIDDGK